MTMNLLGSNKRYGYRDQHIEYGFSKPSIDDDDDSDDDNDDNGDDNDDDDDNNDDDDDNDKKILQPREICI